MKVKFKYAIRTYSGTIDEMVYGSYRDDKLCIGREYVYPRLTANNEALGSVGSNLATLWANASAEYKADLKEYGLRNGSQNIPKTQLPPTNYALWIKLMYAWKEDTPSVDLATLTVEDFELAGDTAATVKNAIDSGYLDPVSVYDDLTEMY
ncbi:MAG: hypothetical protein LHW45_08625 [Candidatus Cloacimonetes bacterium]|nr:hypothetical protein [Candidatus Cloacimonadota bacterium]MDY0367674.1 hypothetical protein [Candidatus Syntrophosphaera sp.]